MTTSGKVLTPEDRPFTNGPKADERWTKAMFDALIYYAREFKASDIKLVPGCPPYIRVYGRWYWVNKIPLSDSEIDRITGFIAGSEYISSRVKGGDYADFAYEVKAGRDERLRFRCNSSGSVLQGDLSGTSLVLRSIPNSVPRLEDVDLMKNVDGELVASPILKNMFPPQGIVLFTGPTGSGKTTTLAAGIGYLLRAHPYLSVETYEDPVEFDYRTAGGKGPLVQMSVTKHLRGDFSRIAPNAARRSSDIVIVGEVRDRASFKGLLNLSDMGMLTISTLHTRSVAETPSRILNAFPADEQPETRASLFNGLRLIVQQRLIRTVDGKRVAVREYLAFPDKLRYELSYLKPEEITPFLRRCVLASKHSLMDDVHAKFKEGLISRVTYRQMEAEFNGMAEIDRSVAGDSAGQAPEYPRDEPSGHGDGEHVPNGNIFDSETCDGQDLRIREA